MVRGTLSISITGLCCASLWGEEHTLGDIMVKGLGEKVQQESGSEMSSCPWERLSERPEQGSTREVQWSETKAGTHCRIRVLIPLGSMRVSKQGYEG